MRRRRTRSWRASPGPRTWPTGEKRMTLKVRMKISKGGLGCSDPQEGYISTLVCPPKYTAGGFRFNALLTRDGDGPLQGVLRDELFEREVR